MRSGNSVLYPVGYIYLFLKSIKFINIITVGEKTHEN